MEYFAGLDVSWKRRMSALSIETARSFLKPGRQPPQDNRRRLGKRAAR
jgi:hypothetical protein